MLKFLNLYCALRSFVAVGMAAGVSACVLLYAGPVCGGPAVDVLSSRSQEIPFDFPRFVIGEFAEGGNGEGQTTAMLALRDLYWLHYNKLTPKATLWDEWLLPPTIWPEHGADQAAARWREVLLERRHIDPEGYVATHQHKSIAHQRGWPFPYWEQGAGFGWHFSFHQTVGTGWRPGWTAKPEEWTTTGVESLGLEEEGWVVRLTKPEAVIAPPAIGHDAYQAPFVQLRWRADLPTTTPPYLEWTTDAAPQFSRDRRFYFEPPEPGKMDYTMVPMYRHPEWTGKITGLRLGLGNPDNGTTVTVQALFSQYDTRHNVNNPSYVTACVDYFLWTRDLNFLRDNIERMRLAMRFMETEFGTDKDGIVKTLWVGHEGTTGIARNADGSVKMLHGRGVGNNYWDLVPFGQKDAYATIRHYGAARKMALMEGAIAKNPGWNIPPSPLMRTADHWTRQAEMSRENGNRLFWNEETGRFTVGIDSEGGQADFGFTFLNLEAIYYGFATAAHARQIMDWLDGRRTVADDTSLTSDIYRWRFAPRATTRRNIDHYGWFWNGADSIPFGYQVQDGGAVLGFSYHDIMARLKTNGPDDAARRLEEILDWYGEVAADGGYRAYYDGTRREGTLQGGNVPGGLGLDREFFESVMVPHVMLEGFLGFEPTADGFRLRPALPRHWPGLRVDNIRIHGRTVTITVEMDSITIEPAPRSARNGKDLQIDLGPEWEIVKSGHKGVENAEKCGMGIVILTGETPVRLRRIP